MDGNLIDSCMLGWVSTWYLSRGEHNLIGKIHALQACYTGSSPVVSIMLNVFLETIDILLLQNNAFLFFIYSAVEITHNPTICTFHIFVELLPIITIFFACLVVFFKNPIYSLLSLILVFFNTVLLLLTFHVEFLALIFLIIYVGAIAVLFLFVIMMFNLKQLQNKKLPSSFWNNLYVYLLFGPKTYYIIIYYINQYIQYNCYFHEQVVLKKLSISYFLKYKHNDILILSDFLYTYYSYVFILSGLILLTAMLGSIVLALSTIEESK